MLAKHSQHLPCHRVQVSTSVSLRWCTAVTRGLQLSAQESPRVPGHCSVALHQHSHMRAAILPTTAVAILALAGVLYLFVRKRKHASGEQKDPPSSVAQTYSCCSRGGPSCGASGSGRTSATLLTRTTAGGHTVSTRGRPSQEVPDSVFVSLGELLLSVNFILLVSPSLVFKIDICGRHIVRSSVVLLWCLAEASSIFGPG